MNHLYAGQMSLFCNREDEATIQWLQARLSARGRSVEGLSHVGLERDLTDGQQACLLAGQ